MDKLFKNFDRVVSKNKDLNLAVVIFLVVYLAFDIKEFVPAFLNNELIRLVVIVVSVYLLMRCNTDKIKAGSHACTVGILLLLVAVLHRPHEGFLGWMGREGFTATAIGTETGTGSVTTLASSTAAANGEAVNLLDGITNSQNVVSARVVKEDSFGSLLDTEEDEITKEGDKINHTFTTAGNYIVRYYIDSDSSTSVSAGDIFATRQYTVTTTEDGNQVETGETTYTVTVKEEEESNQGNDNDDQQAASGGGHSLGYAPY